jgi:riboflavin kinase / FMN adenylyltransferase
MATSGIGAVRALFHAHHQPCAVTIGTFDGVHAGHRALLARTRQIATDRGLTTVAITFSPRPEKLFRGDSALPDICSLDERERRLRAAGADEVIVVPFDASVAAIPAVQFAASLVDDLGLQVLCVGEDFALGRAREGDIAALAALGLEVHAVPLLRGPGGRKISSSDLRTAVAASAA